MLTRTFVGNQGLSSPFCLGNDGESGPMGPCLQVKPGQTMKIKVVNRMDDGMKIFNQRPVSKKDYFNLQQRVDPRFGPRPEHPKEMQIKDPDNIPGLTHSFDTTNLVSYNAGVK